MTQTLLLISHRESYILLGKERAFHEFSSFMTSEPDELGVLLQVLRLFARRHPNGSRTADLNRSKTKAIEDAAELGLPQAVLERAVISALERGFLQTTFSGGSPGSWVTTITQRGYQRRDELEQALECSTLNSEPMATSRGRGRATGPTLAPDRAIRALQEQLDALGDLRGRQFDEAEHAETEWRQFTQGILEARVRPRTHERYAFSPCAQCR